MATSRTATLALWRIGGFPNHHALEKALAQLRAAGLMRPSNRGGAAQQLDPQELASVLLAMRGYVNAEETTRFASLPRDASPGALSLVDRLAELLAEGAESVLSGNKPPQVSISLKRGVRLEAEIRGPDSAEQFSQPQAAAPAGIRTIIEIPPELWATVLELATDTVLRTRATPTTAEAMRRAEQLLECKTLAPPDRSASALGCPARGEVGHLHNQSNLTRQQRKQFVCGVGGCTLGRPLRKKPRRGNNEPNKRAPAGRAL